MFYACITDTTQTHTVESCGIVFMLYDVRQIYVHLTANRATEWKK